MFRVSPSEHSALISQIATSNAGRGGHRKPPFAFTEHGAIQAANVLNSPRAIAMGCARRARLRATAGTAQFEQRARAPVRSA